MAVPIFVTRVKVGRGRDMIMISAESPAGNTAQTGEVESVETFRMVVSPATFREVTELFVNTLKTMESAHIQRASRVNHAGESLGRKH